MLVKVQWTCFLPNFVHWKEIIHDFERVQCPKKTARSFRKAHSPTGSNPLLEKFLIFGERYKFAWKILTRIMTTTNSPTSWHFCFSISSQLLNENSPTKDNSVSKRPLCTFIKLEFLKCSPEKCYNPKIKVLLNNENAIENQMAKCKQWKIRFCLLFLMRKTRFVTSHYGSLLLANGYYQFLVTVISEEWTFFQ